MALGLCPRPAAFPTKFILGKRLLRENARRVGKAFDLNRIAGWITKEHRPLLARLALKPHGRRDNEIGLPVFETSCEGVPIIKRQDNAEMWQRHQMIADLARGLIGERRTEVQAELVSEKVEIDPRIRRTPFGCAQCAGIEFSGFIEIKNMKREMEGNGHGWSFLIRSIAGRAGFILLCSN